MVLVFLGYRIIAKGTETLPNGNASVIKVGATLEFMNGYSGSGITTFICQSLLLILPTAACLLPRVSLAQLNPQSRADAPIIKYRTREEKREAGITTELTPWLRFQGEAESEFLRESVSFSEDTKDQESDFIDPAVQLNCEIHFGEDFESELIFEYSEDSEDPIMEELIMSWDIGDVGLSTGRYYVPFGEYFSNFINGPLIEFAQTRGDVLQIDYDFDDKFEIAAFVFDSRSEKNKGSSFTDNWGLSFEAKLLDEHILLGGGWLSNVADGDFRPLEDERDVFERTVPAWNLYLIAEWDNFGFSLEQVKTTKAFVELDEMENSPSAWNAETAWYPSRTTEIALRYEQAKELADEAEQQVGIQFTWRPANRLSFSVEYIKQKFQRDFVFDDDDREFKDGHIVAGSFSYIF